VPSIHKTDLSCATSLQRLDGQRLLLTSSFATYCLFVESQSTPGGYKAQLFDSNIERVVLAFYLISRHYDTMAIYQTLPDEVQEVDVIIAGGTCQSYSMMKTFLV
jgi:site-specific DNA-cytosine methylase